MLCHHILFWLLDTNILEKYAAGMNLYCHQSQILISKYMYCHICRHVCGLSLKHNTFTRFTLTQLKPNEVISISASQSKTLGLDFYVQNSVLNVDISLTVMKLTAVAVY